MTFFLAAELLAIGFMGGWLLRHSQIVRLCRMRENLTQKRDARGRFVRWEEKLPSSHS